MRYCSDIFKRFHKNRKKIKDSNLLECFSCLLTDKKNFSAVIKNSTMIVEDCLEIQKEVLNHLYNLYEDEVICLRKETKYFMRKMIGVRFVELEQVDEWESDSNAKNLTVLKNYLENLNEKALVSRISDMIDKMEIYYKNFVESSDFLIDKHLVQDLMDELSKIYSELCNKDKFKTVRAYIALQDIFKRIPESEKTDIALTVSNSAVDKYQLLNKKFEQIEQIIQAVEDDLAFLRYTLSYTISQEIIYALAYIPNQELLKETPVWNEIINRHTDMYCEIFQSLLPEQRNLLAPLYDTKIERDMYEKFLSSHGRQTVGYVFNYSDEDIARQIPQNKLPLIYFRLRPIIKLFLASPETSNKNRVLRTKWVKLHLDTVMKISTETWLLDSNIAYDLTSFDILKSRLNLRDYELADILGIDKSAYSRFQNGKSKKNLKSLIMFKLAFFGRFSLDFIQLKTTIPTYGKSFLGNLELESEQDHLKLSNADNDEVHSIIEIPQYLNSVVNYMPPYKDALLITFKDYYESRFGKRPEYLKKIQNSKAEKKNLEIIKILDALQNLIE